MKQSLEHAAEHRARHRAKPAAARAYRLTAHSLSLTLAMIALPGTAHAFRLDYRLGASYLRSDNIRLDQNGAISDSVLSPQLRFDGEHDTAVVQTNFTGAVQYLDYLDDSFQDETRGEFSGRLNWVALPERLHFTVEDRLSQQPVDNLVAYSPGNQQRTNVFEAGPSFFARFGDTTRGQLDLRYTDSYAEQGSTFNGSRYAVAARLVRQLNPTDSLAANLEATQVEYDQFGQINDYKRYDGYATYKSSLASVDIGLDAGYSRLQPQNPNGRTVSSPLFRGNLDWRASSRSVFNAYASYEFADATQNLILNAGDPAAPITTPVPDPNLAITPETFRQRRLRVGYAYTGVRAELQIQPYYERTRYLRAPLVGVSQDVDSTGATVSFSYRLQPQTLLLAYVARQNREFVDASRDDRDATASLGVSHQFSRHWSGQFNAQRRERDSSIPGQDYTENAVILAFFYRR